MKIGKFITLVKERSVLYDSLHPLNKDQKEKEKNWREISAAMNIHSDIAKSRWKSLKDCYTKHLKSKLTKGPAAYVKYMNWQWAERMEFMKPHIKFGLMLTNIQLQDNQETDDLGTQNSSDVQGYQSGFDEVGTQERSRTPEQYETSVTSKTPEKSGNNEIIGISDRSERQMRSPTQDSSSRPISERAFQNVRKRRHAMISPDVNIPVIDRTDQYLKKNKISRYTATELIFLGYAKSIKTFSVRRQAQIKMDIAKIMMEEEIAHFEESTSENEYQ